MAHTYTLTITVTDRQKELLGRWFPRWNAKLDTPHATIEDAFVDILKDSVKNFVSEENLIRLPEVGEALRAAPDSVQDEVVNLLSPYMA
jgi:hypothetical protein